MRYRRTRETELAARVQLFVKGFVEVRVPKLPLTYAALELSTSSGPLWAHLRIKREAFDISGGWVSDAATREPYMKLLRHLHVRAGQIEHVAGYTDNPDLYDRYPIKLFNRLWPFEKWDTDEWLPKIHAVEFMGEPQFGGGKPVAPQVVFDTLLPYRVSRLPTSITLSEERTWRWYAGLSDYPHYDAYRVVAPAGDAYRFERLTRDGAPDGIHETKWSSTGRGVIIEDTQSRDAILYRYLVPSRPSRHRATSRIRVGFGGNSSYRKRGT